MLLPWGRRNGRISDDHAGHRLTTNLLHFDFAVRCNHWRYRLRTDSDGHIRIARNGDDANRRLDEMRNAMTSEACERGRAGARRGPVPCRLNNYSSRTCTLPIAVSEDLASVARFKRPMRSMNTFPECTKGRQWDHGRRSQLQVILQASWNGFWLRR
jgi:hypothetical protein